MLFKSKRKEEKEISSEVNKEKSSVSTSENNKNEILHIDLVNIIEQDFLFISGWYFNESNISVLHLIFDNKESIETDFYIGERKDVSIHNKYSENNHNWGFSIIHKILNNKKPKKLKAVFKDESSQTINFPEFESKTLEYCFDNINSYRENQKKKVLYELIENDIDVSSIEKNTSYNNSKVSYYIEKSIKIKDGVFSLGWFNDSLNKIKKIKLIINGKTSSNKPGYSRRFRKDVNEAFNITNNNFNAGLIIYVQNCKVKPDDDVSFLVVLESGDFVNMPLKIDFSIKKRTPLLNFVLSNIDFRTEKVTKDIKKTILPALHDIWKRDFSKLKPEVREFELEKKPNKFEISLIIPIYGRYDFINYQLAHFVNNNGFENVEIIYAIDDPRIYDEVIRFCKDIAPVYNIYFKVIYFNENLGFGGINNMAAKHANGETYLFLNSDIIPKENNWLLNMKNTYQKLENPGVLGVDLLFYDESIQHAGMSLSWSDNFGIYLNQHPGKGLPKSLFKKEGVESIETVTAACIMIDSNLFEEVGGFDLRYILGDFEDSDLCLQLIDKGYKNYINHDIELYHLERQSQNLVDEGDWKFKLTIFNGWQHTDKWGSLIQKLIKHES